MEHPVSVTKGQIKRETDKALLIQIVTGGGNYADVWFPRSQIRFERDVMWVTDWLLKAKSREIGAIITLDRQVAAQMTAKEAA